MNEESHDSSNIPLCISSQNDTAYYINLENNRRFTKLEKKRKLSSNESEKGLESVTPQAELLPASLLASHPTRRTAHAATAREGLTRGTSPKSAG